MGPCLRRDDGGSCCTAFERIFRVERHLVGRVPMPTGVSILTLAEPR